jgi:tetratricopeptide (TPR) repeat protein
LALLEGATGPAGAILDRAEAAIPRTSASATVAGIAIARGRLCLANGDVERAVSFCRRAQQLAEGGGLAYERVEALYWLGTALLARGQAQPALDALTEALALSDGATPPVALALCAAEDGRLLEYGLAAGIDRERLRDIEAFIREHRSGDRHVAPAPGGKRDGPVRPPIAAWLFGPLRIHRGDTFLPPEAWSRDRARELFALLALHPAGLSQEEICGLMWPALPVERAATGLHSAVYAVRRTLGGKASVQYVSGRYRLSDELDLWVDSRAFDVAVRRARAAVGQAAIEALERAVALYRGRLLEDVGWGWTADLRETFQGNFVDAALRLAHQLARTDRARADALAEQVLMLEPGCAAALDILRPEAPGRVRDALRVGAPGAVAMARPELMVVGPARKAVLAGADARASTGRRSRRGVPVHA